MPVTRSLGFVMGATAAFAMAFGGSSGASAEVALPVAGPLASTPSAHDERAAIPAASPDGNVVTRGATALGRGGISMNGRINPRGAPTAYYFEYGATTDYGFATPLAPLGPKLTAHYAESFDAGLAGWRGGSGADLRHVPTGGVDGRGFVRYTEPTGDDYNHIDGIGVIHLVEYLYPGTFDADAPTVALGGGDPDFRDAKVKRVLRGNAWEARGSELVWWSQIDQAHGIYAPGEEPRYSNWAHTGFFLTDHLFSGAWETASYRLLNDTTEWTYAGTNRALNAQLARNSYVYAPLDDVLAHLDTDFFHVLAYIDNTEYPSGSIDLDDIEIAYRNHSLVLPSNGGVLISAPAGSPDEPAALTDGWRAGPRKMWQTAPNPSGPQEIVYAFKRPVVVERVQLHQHTVFPSAEVEILVSTDGATWTPIAAAKMAESHPAGENFNYLLEKGLAVQARGLKVRIWSGYRAEAWGLGEIEVFGTGAQMQTDDDFYCLNADIDGYRPGETVHYRLVAVSERDVTRGGDQSYTFPVDRRPHATTRPASRIVAGGAKLEARINTLGEEGEVFFEYGPDLTYGTQTIRARAGPELTPRTVVENLTGLAPGGTVHYRVVVRTAAGAVHGGDETFFAR